jgi:TrmH family RNA methyltransferase
MTFGILLAELKIPENIGFIARVMKNFGFKELFLYNCNVDRMSYITSAHAKDILENAVVLNSFEEILDHANMLVGTTGITTLSDERYIRRPIFTPEELREFLDGKGGKVVIAFGREDYGLLKEELELCHMVVSIPTNPEYPVMNVSHAVAVILYELSKGRFEVEEKNLATARDVENLVDNFEKLMLETWYPKHRIKRTKIALRRILGRSLMTKREIGVLHGIVTKAVTYIEHLKKKC